MNYMFNYWLESSTNIDTYNNQLTLKFPDTDTIYSYDSIKEELVPQYAIFVDEEKEITNIHIYGFVTGKLLIIFDTLLLLY